MCGTGTLEVGTLPAFLCNRNKISVAFTEISAIIDILAY